MRPHYPSLALLTALCLSASGCWTQRGGPSPILPANLDDVGAKRHARAGSAVAAAPKTEPAKVADTLQELPATPDDEQIAELMAEVAKVGIIDAAAQQRLLADLKKTPRSQWPMLVDVFRATLQYQTDRNKPAPKETLAARPPAEPPVAKPATSKDTVSKGTASRDTVKPVNPVRLPAVPQTAKNAQPPTQDTLAISKRNVLRDNGTDGATIVTPTRRNPIRADEYPSTAQPSITPPAKPNNQPVQLATAEADIPPIAPRALPAPRVLPAPPAYAKSTSWHESLDETIGLLEKHSPDHNPTTQARLRLLYLAASRRDDATSEIPGLSDDAKGFWSEQLYALGLYLDDEQIPNDRQRATRAAHHARTAAYRLGQMGNLIVRNMAMTTAVYSYGVYDELREYRVAPGQEIIVYAELENFTSEETAKGFHTSLKATYEILDRRGKSIVTEPLGDSEEYCRNLRRDFFVAYSVMIPRDLYNGGEYTLRLNVEDVKSHRTGESSTKFRVQK